MNREPLVYCASCGNVRVASVMGISYPDAIQNYTEELCETKPQILSKPCQCGCAKWIPLAALRFYGGTHGGRVQGEISGKG